MRALRCSNRCRSPHGTWRTPERRGRRLWRTAQGANRRRTWLALRLRPFRVRLVAGRTAASLVLGLAGVEWRTALAALLRRAAEAGLRARAPCGALQAWAREHPLSGHSLAVAVV